MEDDRDTEQNLHEMEVLVDPYVAAHYDNDWYVGKALEVEEGEPEAFISFMYKRR